jgi:hypothetical protein
MRADYARNAFAHSGDESADAASVMRRKKYVRRNATESQENGLRDEFIAQAS